MARRSDERHLNVGQVVVIGGVVEPETVAGIVHQYLFALFQADVPYRAHACLAVHKIGVLTEQQEGIAPEGGGILLRFRNVAQAARGNGGLAVFDGAFPHENGFRELALLSVLIFEGLVSQASQVGNEGHVASRGKAMRTFRGRGAGKEKAEKSCGGAGSEKFVHQDFLVV